MDSRQQYTIKQAKAEKIFATEIAESSIYEAIKECMQEREIGGGILPPPTLSETGQEEPEITIKAIYTSGDDGAIALLENFISCCPKLRWYS